MSGHMFYLVACVSVLLIYKIRSKIVLHYLQFVCKCSGMILRQCFSAQRSHLVSDLLLKTGVVYLGKALIQ